MEAKYKIHRLEINMSKDKDKLELFLNSLNGEIVAIIPNVRPKFMWAGGAAATESLLIVESLK